MINGQGLQALRDAIAASDDGAAESAAVQLTAAAEPDLLTWLAADDPEQVWWAARALGACGTVASIGPLLDLLQHQDVALRTVAAMTMGALPQRLADSTVMQPHLPQLAVLLSDPDGMVRQVAADALAQCGDVAIPTLVEVLRFNVDQGARSRAAYALGKIGTMATAPALYRCLNDQNYLVHTYAHEALDKLGLLENVLLMP